MDSEHSTPEEFAVWLKGYLDISNPKKIEKRQAQIIKNRLQGVFSKKTSEDGSGIFKQPEVDKKKAFTNSANLDFQDRNQGVITITGNNWLNVSDNLAEIC